ncbi:hypothetical protein HZ992_15335 [Rhizobacter sp. AJA081-3]|uniref:hypothetical protein n=1 Tax=Rhizobacter sp. AJA081-3 TaxID=2753607 RepID=UPI001ADEE52F|nr:hypothetical protein [Rhizobacter sp. AJA081-3]QTN21552.1 hypothetical protein HZ992_15335 [Rhizobacter sp. AJA081-3]
MISDRKLLLRRTAMLASTCASVTLAVACGVKARLVSASQVESKLLLAILVTLYVMAIWLGLLHEYASLRRGYDPEAKFPKLSFSDFSSMHSWCSKWAYGSYLIALGLLAYSFLYVGQVRWSKSFPFTESDALGFMLHLSTLALVSLPLITSAARMPGTFAANFRADSQ